MANDGGCPLEVVGRGKLSNLPQYLACGSFNMFRGRLRIDEDYLIEVY